jgi:serine protease Do
MEKRFAMRGRTMLAILLIAALGAVVGLFVYTRVIDKSGNASPGSEDLTAQTIPAVLTSFQAQQGLVDFTYAAEQTVHAVVHVKTKSTVSYPGNATNPLYEFFYGDVYRQPREVAGYGSGVIISADGYIITNNHVIEDADNIEVTLNNNKTYTAEVIGRDATTDIALLKIKEVNLPFIKYGDSDNLRLGEWVLAVGNPFNLTSSVTAGIVSAKGRSLGLLQDQSQVPGIESFIQTDAALNPGNSGGALVNTNAELVGITSAIISPTMSYSGNSFAIPVNIVKKVVNDLREFGEVQRAIIGVNIEDVTSELVTEKKLKLNDVKGIYLNGIIAGGAAEAAGLKENDVIIKIDETNVSTVADLQEQVSKHRPGDKVTIVYIRDGNQKTVPVVLKNLDGNTGVVVAGSSVTVFGSKVEPLTAQEKRNYNLDSGVKVTDTGTGRFKDIGIMNGYIITAVNGKKVTNAAEIRDATSNEKSLTSIEGIQSDGTRFNFQYRN